MNYFSLLKVPLRVAGKLGSALEMAAPSILHPEEILSKSPQLKKLYDFTVKEQRLSRVAAEGFKKEVRNIVEKFGINNEERANQFLNVLEFPSINKRLMTPDELAMVPTDVRQAVVEHINKVTDPIYKIAKSQDPGVGYIQGYFTHFPMKSYVNFLGDEIGRVAKLTKGLTPEDVNYIPYRTHLTHLRDTLKKVSHEDEILSSLRYQRMPSGGRFGPLDEVRKINEKWAYKKDYLEVMEDYVDGAMRKVFFDRYMPIAKKVVEEEPNIALRQFAFDYVTSQRGALSSRSKVFLNEAFAQIFPNPEQGYRGVANAVDWMTRFQYLSKIGLSWFRFPFINSTQTLLTTFPMAGGKNTFLGMKEAILNPSIWQEAKEVGVLFEASLRKGLTESIGIGKNISKIEKGVSWPAKFSEELNRVIAYSVGKLQAGEMGLKGEKAIEHAINLVNRTQFLYHKEALPLIMSRSPAARLFFQFRSFTANYVNFLHHIIETKNWPALARAMGALGVLSGSSAIPFSLWDKTREGLLRNGHPDIGEFNPLSMTAERMGMSPPVDFGKSFEPFNIPSNMYQLFGPSVGPILQFAVESWRRPEEAHERFKRFVAGISPPMTALYRGVTSPTAMTEPTKRFPKGREIGKRSLLETLYARPSLEFERRKYIELIANAFAGGRDNDAQRLIQEAMRKGLKMDKEDIRQAKQRGSKMRGMED